jgi:hypothetical protein
VYLFTDDSELAVSYLLVQELVSHSVVLQDFRHTAAEHSSCKMVITRWWLRGNKTIDLKEIVDED